MSTRTIAGAGIGAALALAFDRALSRHVPRRRFAGQAVGLPIAAAIYPASRSRRNLSSHIVREAIALAGFSALSAAAARRDARRAHQLLAAGWVGHAVFDAVHDGGEHSLIPAWYPAACAGYDVATAARLVGAPAG